MRKRTRILDDAFPAEPSTSIPAPLREHGGQVPAHYETTVDDRTYWYLKKFDDGYDGSGVRLVESHEDGNLISSLCADGSHAPVFDIDFDAELHPSKTPGHYHLYLNKKVPWDKFLNVLKAMSEADLIEPGYYQVCKQRGMALIAPVSDHGQFETLKNKITKSGTLFPDG